MTSFRAALLAALCSIFLASCGDTFRPIAIPEPGTLPPAQASKTAQVVTGTGAGTVTNYNLSGGTVTGQAPVGQGPAAALLFGSRVFVANQTDNTLSVFNAAAPQSPVPGTITLDPGASPKGLTAATGLAAVYVTYNGLDQVGVVNSSTSVLTATVALNANGFIGSGPTAMITNLTGTRLFVANQGSNNISIIDTASNAVIATAGDGICNTPIAFARTPDIPYVYVACRGSNHILLINSNTNFVDNIIPVGTAPNFLAFDAANKRLIVTNEGGASVSFLNENFSQPLSLQHSITTVPIGAAPVQAASLPDGSRVYVATQGNNVVVIDSSTLTVKTNIAVGGSGQQIGVSSDGIRVAVTTAAPDVLQVIDTSTDTVAASHTLVGPARALLIF